VSLKLPAQLEAAISEHTLCTKVADNAVSDI